MSISVEKMLQFENFSDFKILAGSSGIKRKITSVSVMDAPDLHKWVKGGEFFLTTGYCMKDDPKEIEEMIIKINNLGASAFGIKLNRFIDVLPEKVIETANELAFPIIQIPLHFAFIDIINPVLITIINEQGKRLQHSENVHKSFTQLVINGGDTQQIINTLRDILKIDVAFYDTYHDKVYIKVYSDENFYRRNCIRCSSFFIFEIIFFNFFLNLFYCFFFAHCFNSLKFGICNKRVSFFIPILWSKNLYINHIIYTHIISHLSPYNSIFKTKYPFFRINTYNIIKCYIACFYIIIG